MIPPLLQTLINSSPLDPNLSYWYKLYYKLVSCILSLEWQTNLVLNTDYSCITLWIHLYLYTVWMEVLHLQLLFMLLGDSKDLWKLKCFALFSLIKVNVIDEIISIGCISKYEKNNPVLIWLAVIVLSDCITIWFACYTTPSKDIFSLNKCTHCCFVEMFAWISHWWYLSPSWLVPLSRWKAACIWSNIEWDVYHCVQER